MTGGVGTRRWRADPAALDLMHALLDEVSTGVAVADRTAIALALSELMSNAIEHGRATWLWLAVEVHPDRIRAVLQDDGERTPVRLRSTAVSDDPLAESGRGMDLARTVADLRHSWEAGRNRWVVVRGRDVPAVRPP